MGCGCSGGGGVVLSSFRRAKNNNIAQDCDYTVELMLIWKEKLLCVQNQNLYQEIGYNKYKINFALGTVQSAINTGNVCYFKKQLDQVNNIILTLISLEKC